MFVFGFMLAQPSLQANCSSCVECMDFPPFLGSWVHLSPHWFPPLRQGLPLLINNFVFVYFFHVFFKKFPAPRYCRRAKTDFLQGFWWRYKGNICCLSKTHMLMFFFDKKLEAQALLIFWWHFYATKLRLLPVFFVCYNFVFFLLLAGVTPLRIFFPPAYFWGRLSRDGGIIVFACIQAV